MSQLTEKLISENLKSALDEISTHHRKNSFHITFHCGQNKMEFLFCVGPR